MPNYKTMYYKTFNAITDAQQLIEQASALLKDAQQECEDLVIEADDTPVSIVLSEEKLPDR